MPRLSRRPFLDFLCDEHVIVTPDWETMNPSVTHILYDHGLRCPPHGRKLHKGESDASYNQFSKKARIGIIIWRDDQVVLSEVMEELDCNGSSVQAEALAMYLLLKRAIQQGIRSLEVCADCEVVDRVICGEQRPGDKDTLGELSNHLRWMISHFDELTCRRVPNRECVSFVDGFLRNTRLFGKVHHVIGSTHTNKHLEASVSWKNGRLI